MRGTDLGAHLDTPANTKESAMTNAPLEAPQETIVLEAPQPVAAIETTKVGGMVPIAKEALPELDKLVTKYVDQIATCDVHSPTFANETNAIRTLGDNDIRKAAETSNRLLQSPVRAMKNGGASDASKISTSLVDLRRTVEDLDPKEATGVKKLLGLIPFGDKLTDYFRRYESSQAHLDAIVKALYDGQDELRKDNAALGQEKTHLWATMQMLAQHIYVAEHLDQALVAKIAEIETADPERAKVLREDVLFYVRQKHQDLLTQLAVSIQGYLAIDLIRKNILELIKGVDRACTTTISALRTAVIVAQALCNQKLVLDQIGALNTTTSSLIESTSTLLATQTVDIHKQASEATVSIESLQKAFANIYQAMDAVDTYKLQALDAMATTVGSLQVEIDKAQTYLQRAQRSDSSDPTTIK